MKIYRLQLRLRLRSKLPTPADSDSNSDSDSAALAQTAVRFVRERSAYPPGQRNVDYGCFDDQRKLDHTTERLQGGPWKRGVILSTPLSGIKKGLRSPWKRGNSVGQSRTGPRRANMGRSVPNSAGQDLAWPALNRTGQGREGQCRGMQDKVDPGWVGHGRIGRVGRGRAISCKAGHGRAGSSSVGQGRIGQRQAGWIRAAPPRTG